MGNLMGAINGILMGVYAVVIAAPIHEVWLNMKALTRF